MHGRNHLEAAEELVNQELDMLVRQPLELDNVVEVRAHQIGDQVAAEGAENTARRQVKHRSHFEGTKDSQLIEFLQRCCGCKDVQQTYDLQRRRHRV